MRFYHPTLLTILALLAGQMPAAHADPRAVDLLQQAHAATARLRSLSANVEFTRDAEPPVRGTVALQRPNLARIDMPGSLLIVADGRVTWTYLPPKGQYMRIPPGPAENPLRVSVGEPVDVFFQLAIFGQRWEARASYAGAATIAGVSCDLIDVAPPSEEQEALRIAIGASDHLVRQVVGSRMVGGKPVRRIVTLRELKVDAPLDASRFQWEPPAGAIEWVAGPLVAPLFARPSAAGETVQLEAALRGKKAVLLYFWSAADQDPAASLRRLQELHKQLSGRGLVVLAVNLGDTAEALRQRAASTGLTFPLLVGGDTKGNPLIVDYRLQRLPAAFLYGANRQLRWRGETLDPALIGPALNAAGFP